MIITTTPIIEGKQLFEYKGLVFGDMVSGLNFVATGTVVVLR